ncbi:MAG: hypothetical protein DME75_01370 [Verrucomicrobia bacterium]|nr:MAG: hypothetical protein DME75_01370 [Verrucomicrobiota bacterium]
MAFETAHSADDNHVGEIFDTDPRSDNIFDSGPLKRRACVESGFRERNCRLWQMILWNRSKNE